MIEDINNLLNNWHYPSALSYLKKYGKNQHLIEILSSGESHFFTKKLRQELENLKNRAIKEEHPVKESPKPRQIESLVDSDTIEAIKQQRNKVLREQDQLRWQHVLMVEKNATPEQLTPIVKRIMDLSHQLHELWYKIDYHQSHGILPPDPPDPIMEVFENVTTVEQLIKIRNNQRSNISKVKKGSRSADNLEVYKAILLEAEKRIKTAYDTI